MKKTANQTECCNQDLSFHSLFTVSSESIYSFVCLHSHFSAISHFPKVLDDRATVIDVEMQASPDADIAVRSRLYQAQMYVNQLIRGEIYQRSIMNCLNLSSEESQDGKA